jgi:hypothetical protein
VTSLAGSARGHGITGSTRLVSFRCVPLDKPYRSLSLRALPHIRPLLYEPTLPSTEATLVRPHALPGRLAKGQTPPPLRMPRLPAQWLSLAYADLLHGFSKGPGVRNPRIKLQGISSTKGPAVKGLSDARSQHTALRDLPGRTSHQRGLRPIKDRLARRTDVSLFPCNTDRQGGGGCAA